MFLFLVKGDDLVKKVALLLPQKLNSFDNNQILDSHLRRSDRNSTS